MVVRLDGAADPLLQREAPGWKELVIRWREPPSPVQVLASCGWLSAAEARDPLLRIDAAMSSHAVFRVTAPDGRAAVVKLVRKDAAEAGRSLLRELYVYRMANWVAPLAEVLPKPIFIDERRQVLAVESLALGPTWPAAGDGGVGAVGVGAQLGSAMAKWHRATQDLPLLPSLAVGVLQLPDGVEEAQRERPPPTRRLMTRIAADAELASALREALSAYRPCCLIHGDIRRENWLLNRETPQRHLKVIDWEMSGAGDPAWDLGSVLAEATLDVIRANADVAVGASGWPIASQSPFEEFLASYIAEGGLPVLTGAACEQLVLYAVARLLHVACEWADWGTDADDDPAARLVAHAKLRLARRRDAVAWLAGSIAA